MRIIKKIVLNKRTINSWGICLLAFILHFPMISSFFDLLRENNIPIISLLPPINTIIVNIIFIVLTVSLLLLRGKIVKPLVLGLSFFSLFGISLLVHNELFIFFFRGSIYFLSGTFCIICLFDMIDNPDHFFSILKKYVVVSVLYSIIEYIYWNPENAYDMGFTYKIAIPTLTSLVFLIKNKHINFKYLFAFAICLIAILKCGSRGGLSYILLALFFFLYYLKHIKRVVILISLFSVVIVLFFNWEFIVDSLGNWFPNSRTIFLLKNNLLLYDAGRSEYYQLLINEISNHPLEFRGLYYDRIFLSSHFARTEFESMWGSYAHNIILEPLFQFGIVSIPFLGMGIFKVLSAIHSSKKNENNKKLIIIFVSYALGQLFLSSSYLIAISFGCLCGTVMIINRTTRIKRDVVHILGDDN